MSIVGLIGGVSPEATHIYYRLLNQAARGHFGGQHSARVLFHMLDYGVMFGHYQANDWDAFRAEVVTAALSLKAGGARAIAITSGTTHVAADAVAEATGLPVIHMLDSLTEAMVQAGSSRPLLLGTPWTMQGEYFRAALATRFTGSPSIPDPAEREMIGRIIFDELVDGEVKPASRRDLSEMIARHQTLGADGVILGCTELCMILNQGDCDIPVFSTTHIHAAAIDACIQALA